MNGNDLEFARDARELAATQSNERSRLQPERKPERVGYPDAPTHAPQPLTLNDGSVY